MFGVIYDGNLHVDINGRVAVFQTREEAENWARRAEIVSGNLKVIAVSVKLRR